MTLLFGRVFDVSTPFFETRFVVCQVIVLTLRETTWVGEVANGRGEDVENASLRAYETNETRAVSPEQGTTRERARRTIRKKQTGERNRRGGVCF